MGRFKTPADLQSHLEALQATITHPPLVTYESTYKSVPCLANIFIYNYRDNNPDGHCQEVLPDICIKSLLLM